MLKKKMFTIENILKAGSSERRAWGTMRSEQPQTPRTHGRLKSLELLRWTSFMISGILNSGMATPAVTPMA